MARQFDSAVTRVRPFFQPLLARDPSGASWLSTLLRLGEANPYLGEELASESGPLLPWVSNRRFRPDRALRSHGILLVELEDCFERRLPPTESFLAWLIEHSSAMTWPKDQETADLTQRRREELFGHHGLRLAAEAKAEALAELRKVGAAGSNGKWWVFEGFTQVDCFLETENLILLIEGKRTEPISSATRWFPQRNQLLRNLEVGRALARQKEKEYALILMAEEYMPGMSLDDVFASLPHLTPRQRSDLLRHYLGCVTWSQALAKIFFPHTVQDVAKKMQRSHPRRDTKDHEETPGVATLATNNQQLATAS
jgi:hypothetical protein